MTNFQVYKKTLSFSFVSFLVDLLSFAILGGVSVAGFFIGEKINSKGLIGLIVGVVIGLLLVTLVEIFIRNRIKAGQISMMTKGVLGEELPEDHVFKAGMESVKSRFGAITGFYFITRAIKAIFNQLSRLINRVGTVVGGQVGDSVTSAIDSAIQILIGYLCDCCLGWILYRKDEHAAKAGCEGAVIFFKHGKTLTRNIGRIFGLGLVSLLLIGGAFMGLSYVIYHAFPNMFVYLVNEFNEIATKGGGTLPAFFANPYSLMIVAAAVTGVIFFGIIHSVFIRPFILTGVLRNYMESGIAHMPTEADFKELDAKSPRFAKLHQSVKN